MKTGKGAIEHGRFHIPFRHYGDHANVLLCVSGILQTMAVWRAVTRRFSPHFTVVVFDMPGVGRSRIKSGSTHVTVQEQIDVVHALVQHFAPSGDLTLAGSSWGTAIAAGYAAQCPAAVQHLVLSSFGMKPNAEMERIVEHAQALYHARNYAAGADLIIDMLAQGVATTYKRQIASQFENLSDANASAFHEHCLNILKLGHLQDVIDLSQIRARTLIVNGSEDRIIDLDDMWLAKNLIPDCECLLVDGVGHFLHFERPEILDDYEDFMVARAVPPGTSRADRRPTLETMLR
ncbi:alpha/beta fold hydrolase [Chromatocurvus halotolerans]|uniref:Pimeloyl-ACP methyl ester carboxylesterase n=1 Tax=Chromatocurvus halotolerans TaxID=1132028 RepID=A0A4V2SC93_9GAMM|nr:alpha/beta hydrolase [Chromatocurvus halotolerans]TCO78510.1 pimeloyl-ACP methyl ester carboxylesterase [Chromatocurvus halotolerans]